MTARLSLADGLFPVQAFFNTIPDYMFLATLSRLTCGIGQVYNSTGAILAEEPEDRIPPEMVEFFVIDEIVLLSVTDAMKYADMALNAYQAANPTERAACEKIRAEIAATAQRSTVRR